MMLSNLKLVFPSLETQFNYLEQMSSTYLFYWQDVPTFRPLDCGF